MNRLSPRQMLFCLEYLSNGFSAVEAYKAAYGTSDHSKTSPVEAAYRVLKNPNVRKYIKQVLRAKIERRKLTIDNILSFIESALFFDPKHLFEYDSSFGGYVMRSIDKIPEEIRRCISSIRARHVEIDGEITTFYDVEFVKKDKVLELAMKYLGLLRDNVVNVHVNSNRIDFDKLCSDEEYFDEDKIIDSKVLRITRNDEIAGSGQTIMA